MGYVDMKAWLTKGGHLRLDHDALNIDDYPSLSYKSGRLIGIKERRPVHSYPFAIVRPPWPSLHVHPFQPGLGKIKMGPISG